MSAYPQNCQKKIIGSIFKNEKHDFCQKFPKISQAIRLSGHIADPLQMFSAQKIVLTCSFEDLGKTSEKIGSKPSFVQIL